MSRPGDRRVEFVGECDIGGKCARLGGRSLGHDDRGELVIEVGEQLGVLGKLGEKVLQRDVELAAVQRDDLLLQPIAERIDRIEVVLDGVAAAGRRHRDRSGDRGVPCRRAGRNEDAAARGDCDRAHPSHVTHDRRNGASCALS